MKLFLLGATGRTGTELVDLALARGHEVTAFVRSPRKIGLAHDRLAVVQGDPRDPDQMAAALVHHDAVISALGPRTSEAFRPHELLAAAMNSTVRAMTAAGVHRVLVVSAALLFPERGLAFRVFRWLLRHHVRDVTEMERALRVTHLDWTIARPPRLFVGPDERYQAARDALPRGPRSMSFRAVAAFMLDELERAEHIREIVGLARPLGVAS